MTKFLASFLFIFPMFLFGQYPFENFESIDYKSLDFKMIEKENALEYSCQINSFFDDFSDLQIIINGNSQNFTETFIQIKSNHKTKKYFEKIPAQGTDGLYIADFNGDGLRDIKIVSYYMGSGLASLNVRIIYLFQKKDKEFTKISFDDKIGSNLIERDINKDGNFEIITMTLQDHKNHNYWLFNVYNFSNDNLVCANEKVNYPIMIQFLYRDNYKITTKLSQQEMKKFQLTTPNEISIDK